MWRRIRLRLRSSPSLLPRRNVHTPPKLPYEVENGLGDFLPPTALKTIAVDYQQSLLQNLNDEVLGTEMQDMSVLDTIMKAGTSRTDTLAFNYASLALNNHFFLERLKAPEAPYKSNQHEISAVLQRAITQQHGSLAQLKSAFSAAAMGMFTSGYVWFVTDSGGQTAVLPTFGPGSLLMRSRTYMADEATVQNSAMFVPNNRGEFLDLEEGPFAGEDQLERAVDIQKAVVENPELALQYLGKETTTQLLNHEKLSKMLQKDVGLVEIMKDPSQLANRIQKDPELATILATYFSQFFHRPFEMEEQEESKNENDEEPDDESSPSSNGRSSDVLKNPPQTRSMHTSARSMEVYKPASVYSSSSAVPSFEPDLLEATPSYPTRTSEATRASKMAALLGETIYPLFCISVHEHAWMSAGYGVNGKEEYLKRFWSVVDWQKVSQAYNSHVEGDVVHGKIDYQDVSPAEV